MSVSPPQHSLVRCHPYCHLKLSSLLISIYVSLSLGINYLVPFASLILIVVLTGHSSYSTYVGS